MNIIVDFIPIGRANRPALYNPHEYITIHNTGNTSKGADAIGHGYFLKTTTDLVSWHYTVDSVNIVQHLPDNETAFHAGDGSGNGNRKSIGIEIAVNSDGNLELAHDRAAELTANLLNEYTIPLDRVMQHNYWSGKNCPEWLRNGNPYTWNTFLSKVKFHMYKNLTKAQAKIIVKEKAGLSDSTIQYIADDYRWGDDLIIKLAHAMK